MANTLSTFRAIATIMVASLISALGGVHVATADLRGCDNCITAGDIARGAVRASELNDDLQNSITRNDIATGGVASAEILNGSVNVVDLAPGARTAAGTLGFGTALKLNTTATRLRTLKFTVPGPGVLWVQVSGQYAMSVTAPADDAEIGTAKLALCTVQASLTTTDCGGQDMTIHVQDADNADNQATTPFYTRSLAFNVPSAGIATLYVNGASGETGAPFMILNNRVTAIFAPAALQISSPS